MPSWMDEAIAAASAEVDHTRPISAPPTRSSRVLLVDGDYLAYYASGNDETEAGRARQNAIEKIEAFRALSGSSKVVVHITASYSSKGGRFDAATVKPYQGQRAAGRKPKNWYALRQWLEQYRGDAFKVKVWSDREADDGMAYHAAVLGWEDAVVASADKDMRMYPGSHIDWQSFEMTHVQPGVFRIENEITGKEFGHYFFWKQMLMGDTADNIPGLEHYLKENGKKAQVGEKTATHLLREVTNDAEAASTVAALYGYTYMEKWADRFAEQASLLWMREDRAASPIDWLRVVDPDIPYRAALEDAAEGLVGRIRDGRQYLQQVIDNQ